MQFGNPAMLIGLLLIAIPIIIALLHRRRHQEVRWAAMAFLEAAIKKNKRRLTFQNLLLLLVRAAILLFLVGALARPLLEETSVIASAARTNRHLVLVLDRSFSMAHRAGMELSAMDRGKEAVSEILGHYARSGDQVHVFLADETAQARFRDPLTMDAATRKQVIRDLSAEEPSHFATDASRSIRMVLDAIRDGEGKEMAPGVRTEIIFITDLQRNAWAVEAALRDPGLPKRLREFNEAGGVLRIVDVGTEDAQNLAVQAFAPADAIITPSVPVRIVAVVQSFGAADEPNVEVALVVDGEVRKKLTLDVPAGGQMSFDFHYVFSKAGSHAVTARIAADPLPMDNERHIAMDVRERVPVLIVDGDPRDGSWKSESDFYALALSPGGGDAPGEVPLLEATIISEAGLGGEALHQYAVVVLANVAALADDQVQVLERYVSSGGGLLIALGDKVDAEFYRESLYREGEGILPAAPGGLVGEEENEDGMRLIVKEISHPALLFFDDDQRLKEFDRIWFGHCLSSTAIAPEARTLLELKKVLRSGGDLVVAPGPGVPLLLEKEFGRGRVMLWATSLDDQWHGLPRSWTYVALMQLLTIYLSDTASVGKNLVVGDAYDEMVAPSDYSDQVTLVTPTRGMIPKSLLPDPDGGGHFRLSHDSCEEAGIYSVLYNRGEAEGIREGFFAVNVRTEESDLTPISPDELRDLLPGVELLYTPFLEVGSLREASSDSRGRAAIWKFLLLLVVAFLVTETLLARWVGR